MSLLEKDKRKFSIIIGSKKCGTCSGASPSLAAKKVKGKRSEFYLKEMTKGSKKKLYGPYSSKKKVVQRGGEENSLSKTCNTVLEILRNCDGLRPVDEEMSNKYNILEMAYSFLGITHMKDTDKCRLLKDIIRMRDSFTIQNKNGVYTLCHCLCSLSEKEDNIVEINFCSEYKKLINKRLNKHTDFYTNHWSRFINFLRNIIKKIESEKKLNIAEMLLRNHESNIRLGKLKKEFNQHQINNMRGELEQLKGIFAKHHYVEQDPIFNKRLENLMMSTKRPEQHAGPAQELNSNNRQSRGFPRGPADSGPNKPLPSYALTNNELAEIGLRPNGSSLTSHKQRPSYLLNKNESRELGINQIPQSMLQPVRRKRNVKPIQPSHNNQKTVQEQPQKRNGISESNLSAELGSLLNNNNSKQNPPNMSNLEARLAAALRNNNNSQENPQQISNLSARLAALRND